MKVPLVIGLISQTWSMSSLEWLRFNKNLIYVSVLGELYIKTPIQQWQYILNIASQNFVCIILDSQILINRHLRYSLNEIATNIILAYIQIW